MGSRIRQSSRGVIAVLIGGLALTGSANAQPKGEKTIVIEGSASGTNANAMEQAKLDALRKAVEQACGTFISAQTKTKEYTVVRDKIMGLSAGFVTEFEVLERRVEKEVSYCKVRAKVAVGAFEVEWERLRHTVDAEGNPRCMVVVVEDNNVDDEAPPKTDGVVQSTLEKFFLDKGVQLMDRGAADDVKNRDIDLAALNDDVKKLAAMAAAFKADVVIRGVAEARRAGTTELSGRTLYKWSATVNIRAYHTDSAQLIMSNSYSATKPSVNSNAGGDEALKACADENAAKILQDIGAAWRQRQNVRRIARVTIENCDRDAYKVFEKALREVDGVQEVRLREFVNNVCQVEVDWAYDLERLATRIEELKAPEVRYKITEQSHDRITVRIAKQEPKATP
jgi:hypothetical protein